MLETLLRVWSGRRIRPMATALALGLLVIGSSAPAEAESEFKIAVASLGNEAFDPILSVSNNQYLRLIFDSLVGSDRASKNISKETGVASDWTISDDYRTFTFQIRAGLKFHDGEELNAYDVVFSLERWNDSRALNNPIARDIASIRAIDPLRVEIVFDRARPNLLYQLSAMNGHFGWLCCTNRVMGRLSLSLDRPILRPL